MLRASRRSAPAGAALLLAGLAYAVAELARAPRWTVDDAFIVARYAENLVRRGVFAYNLDGARVEGVTSPLFALVAAAAVAVDASPIRAMTVLGGASLLASGPLVYALARACRTPPVLAGALACAWLAIPEQLPHATSGLETQAFVAAELGCALAFVRAWRSPRRSATRALAIACLFASLVRPEGIAVAAVLVGLMYARLRRSPRRAAFARDAALWVAAPLALLLAARLAYFHELLPNTYYAKLRGAPTLQVAREVTSLFDDYLADFVVPGVATIALARLTGGSFGRIGSSARAAAAGSALALACFGAIYRHADVMNYSRRFALHVMPWLVVLTALVLAHAARLHARLRARARLSAVTAWSVVAAAAALFALVWIPRARMRRELELALMERHIVLRREWYDPAVTVLKARLPETARLAVYPDAGYLPWRTGLYTIDFGRLNDRYLARDARGSDDVIRYFFDANPDAVALSTYGPDRYFNATGARIVQDPRFTRYALAGRWSDKAGWGLELYLRRP